MQCEFIILCLTSARRRLELSTNAHPALLTVIDENRVVKAILLPPPPPPPPPSHTRKKKKMFSFLKKKKNICFLRIAGGRGGGGGGAGSLWPYNFHQWRLGAPGVRLSKAPTSSGRFQAQYYKFTLYLQHKDVSKLETFLKGLILKMC